VTALHVGVFPTPPSALPSWLVSGLALGVAASVVVAVVFVLGERYAPAPDRSGPRVDGAGRRRAEIRALFRSADERFVEDHSLGGVHVAFYLPERDVAITFDPRAYLRLADGGTRVLLCEPGMPAAALARRLPFDLPGATRRSPRGDPVDAAFDVLDLGRDADEEEVRAAYRERVKERHPDQGGSEEAFTELQEAYTTAREHARD
jgi:DnaJ-domain-containing protein 1